MIERHMSEQLGYSGNTYWFNTDRRLGHRAMLRCTLRCSGFVQGTRLSGDRVEAMNLDGQQRLAVVTVERAQCLADRWLGASFNPCAFGAAMADIITTTIHGHRATSGRLHGGATRDMSANIATVDSRQLQNTKADIEVRHALAAGVLGFAAGDQPSLPEVTEACARAAARLDTNLTMP